MILHTFGIEYDDRIRKEILSVKKLYPDIDFHIYAILESKANENGDFISSYGVKYTIPLLKSRLKYRQGGHLLQKAWDFYKTVRPELDDYDAIWCADVQPLFFLLLCRKPIIWDLHEIPEIFLKNSVTKFILRFLMNRCKVVIHANAQRIQYLKDHHAIDKKNHHKVIRNYPDEAMAKKTDEVYDKFAKWLDGSECVYLQCATDFKRCQEESFEGIMKINGLKAVAVGNYNQETINESRKKYGAAFDKKFFFTGLVPQEMTPHYIRSCTTSLVLYRNTSANNYYCEPNRMFQSIINGCPVVVGNNPPMRELVEEYNFGIVIPSDGSSAKDIVEGIKNVSKNRDKILQSINANKKKILWDSQMDEIIEIISQLFD